MGKLARDSASKKEKRSHTPLSLSHSLSPSHSLSSHHLNTRSNLRRSTSAANCPAPYTSRSQAPSSPRRSLRRHPRRLRPSEPYLYPSPSPPSTPPPSPSPSPSSSASNSRRREKKLTVVLRLNRAGGRTQPPDLNSSGVSAASSCDDDSKPLKKRRLSGPRPDADGGDGSVDVWSHRSDARRKAEKRNGDAKTNECVSGEKNDNSTPGSTPLQDAKTLEFILHKLQKKDTYGVYAEPVDPNELPDYHDVIEQPMDFGTIRKKLGSGAYTSLEQFESDVFLICTNAMRYNAPDTIYYKQACAIQELARKRFDKLRVAVQNEMELESAEKARSNSMSKKSVKSVSLNGNEPVGSDFTSGATLANTGDTFTGLNNAQIVLDKSGSVDGPIVDTNPFLDENRSDKADYLLVKGLQSKFGRKPFVVDENRRLTYNNSDLPETRSEPVFSTFESEVKQLVVVGLHADHSYARSLARFAATLGPVAWRIASRRIEQVLPAGYKFGRGWVGEYEPLQTPVLSFSSCSERQPAFISNSQQCSELNKVHETKERSTPTEDDVPKHMQLSSGASAAVCKQKLKPSLDGKPGWFGSIAAVKPTINKICPQQQQRSLNLEAASDYDVKKETQNVCSSAFSNVITNDASFRAEHSSPATTSRLQEMALKSKSIVQPIPFKQPEGSMPLLTSEHASQSGNVVITMEDRDVSLPNGISKNNVESTNMLGCPSVGFISNHQATLGFLSHGNNDQSLNDQVKAMMMLSGKIENQPKSLNSTVVSSAQIAPHVQSVRRDSSSAAATAAAKAWMSVGAQGLKPIDMSPRHMQIAATSLYNPTRELPHSVSRSNEDASGFGRLQLHKNRFSGQSLPQNLHFGPDVRFQNSRPVAFPQLVAADLSRFQVQSPWRGLGLLNSQQNQKADMLPPDLNIGFQPPASPVGQQSSSIQVDSQQPDLALQL